MMTNQSKVLAAAVCVAGVIGGVTLLDRNDDAKSTAVAAASSVETSVLPTVAPTTLLPATVALTTIPATTIPAPPDAGCATTGPSAALDRDQQQAWLCLDGYITTRFAVSTAWSMPDPGVYQIYAKDRVTSSTFGGHVTTLNHFVAFSYGENTGARVAFHAVPILQDGSLEQPLDSVGDLSRRGESSGCIRVVPEMAVLIWETLSIGDTVTVLN
jgi:hypothetical protein